MTIRGCSWSNSMHSNGNCAAQDKSHVVQSSNADQWQKPFSCHWVPSPTPIAGNTLPVIWGSLLIWCMLESAFVRWKKKNGGGWLKRCEQEGRSTENNWHEMNCCHSRCFAVQKRVRMERFIVIVRKSPLLSVQTEWVLMKLWTHQGKFL